jgi:hypothetical protein
MSLLLVRQYRSDNFCPRIGTMLNGIEMVCEMASKGSDWSVSFPLPIFGMTLERCHLLYIYYFPPSGKSYVLYTKTGRVPDISNIE